MKFFHSTIQIKLEEILESGFLKNGMESPEDEAYIAEWGIMEQYHAPSENYIYFWHSLKKAIDCAKFISSHSKFCYTTQEKKPIIIEFNIPKKSPLLSRDPDSNGFRYRGEIQKNNFKKIYPCAD